MNSRRARLVYIGLTACALTGCSVELPVELGDPRTSTPRYDDGVMYGSGNNTQNEAAADSVEATTATRADGGVMYGSGN